MNSNNYSLQKDVINAVGGVSTSSSYKLQYNLAEPVGGNSSSSSYQLDQGYLEKNIYLLDFDLSSTSINLGTLTTAAIATATPAITLTITALGSAGYTIYVKDKGNGSGSAGLYRPTGAGYLIASSTATLSAGTEGYGLQASSPTATIAATYNKSNNDVGAFASSGQVLASSNKDVISEAITVNTKAAIKSSTPAGNYQDVVYYTITMNY